MNDMYNAPNAPRKSGTRLPNWFWVLTAVGLIVSVLAGYFSGSNIVNIWHDINIEDTNGENTDLCTLDFKGFLGVYDGYYEYNHFDSEISYIMYDTSRDCDYSLETYSNSFSGAYTDQEASFLYLNYYDVCFVHELSFPRTLNIKFSSEIKNGNLEGRLLYVSSDFKVELNENDIPIIKDEYITVISEFKAGITREESVNVTENGILIFVVAGESATGSYSLKIS